MLDLIELVVKAAKYGVVLYINEAETNVIHNGDVKVFYK